MVRRGGARGEACVTREATNGTWSQPFLAQFRHISIVHTIVSVSSLSWISLLSARTGGCACKQREVAAN